MALTATADLIMSAAVNGAAVPAFNAITLEHAEGIATGVERSGAGLELGNHPAGDRPFGGEPLDIGGR